MIHNLQGFGNSLLSRSILLHGQRHRSWSHHGDHGRVDRPHEEVQKNLCRAWLFCKNIFSRAGWTGEHAGKVDRPGGHPEPDLVKKVAAATHSSFFCSGSCCVLQKFLDYFCFSCCGRQPLCVIVIAASVAAAKVVVAAAIFVEVIDFLTGYAGQGRQAGRGLRGS